MVPGQLFDNLSEYHWESLRIRIIGAKHKHITKKAYPTWIIHEFTDDFVSSSNHRLLKYSLLSPKAMYRARVCLLFLELLQ